MTRMLSALARRPAGLARRRPAPDPARETMRTFVRTLARLATPPGGREALKSAAPGAPETKLLPATPDSVDESGIFEGYASLFGMTDLAKDVVQPGAFTKSLAIRGPRGVRMLWQHDPSEPIGTWLALVEDARGLRVRGRLNLAVGRAREIHALMREGAIDGLSIGYRVTKAAAERASGKRLLHEVDLWEISIVTFPMLPAARVAAVKGAPPTLAQTIRRAAKKLFPGHAPAAA